MNHCNRVRALVLGELLAFVAFAAIFACVLARVMVDGMYLQRIAADDDARARTIESLSRALITAAREAPNSAVVEQQGATVVTFTEEKCETVFRFTESLVTCIVDGRVEAEWSAPRLDFVAILRPDTRALYVEFVELPPPRAIQLRSRNLPLCVRLPAVAGRNIGSGEWP